MVTDRWLNECNADALRAKGGRAAAHALAYQNVRPRLVHWVVTKLKQCRLSLVLLLAVTLAISAAHAVAPAPRMTGERLLKRLESVDSSSVPWGADSKFSREELAYLHTVTNIEFARGYVEALYDATEGKEWCYDGKHKIPKPDTFWDESRWGLYRLSPERLKRNAADLLVEIWREKWPCPANQQQRQE